MVKKIENLFLETGLFISSKTLWTSYTRAFGYTKQNVDAFSIILEESFNTYQDTTSRDVLYEETGLSIVQSKYVVRRKGKM